MLRDEKSVIPPSSESANVNVSETPRMFICPITDEIMSDPVLTVDGHSYDRKAIEEWLKNHDTSPMTGLKLPDKTLTPNLNLRQAIGEYLAKRPTLEKVLTENELLKAISKREAALKKPEPAADAKLSSSSSAAAAAANIAPNAAMFGAVPANPERNGENAAPVNVPRAPAAKGSQPDNAADQSESSGSSSDTRCALQ